MHQNQQSDPSKELLPTHSTHVKVRFKKLPFYDVLAELLKPSSLPQTAAIGQQECNFYFHLTAPQATGMTSSRDVRHGNRAEGYTKQVQIRFSLLETSCEQEDCFPPGLIVTVNNKHCNLPNLTPINKPGVEPKRPPKPINVSQFIKLSVKTPNCVNVKWASEGVKKYAITINLVHKRNFGDLLEKMRSKGTKNKDLTIKMIKKKLNDKDCEIATTSIKVSLICPLGKIRMKHPCRSKTCRHLQCFDASVYLQMNERKPTWNCPICNNPALYEDLDIDEYFQDVLNSPLVTSDVNEVLLNKNGSWSIQFQVKEPLLLDTNGTTSNNADNMEDNATSSTDKSKARVRKIQEKDVVDLTLSDSDDDDEPPAKRKAFIPNFNSANKFSGTASSSKHSASSREATTIVSVPLSALCKKYNAP